MITDGQVVALNSRKISATTCEKFGYSIGNYHGKPCHIANYYDTAGALVAQKLRFNNPKDFLILGDIKKAGLFGSQLYGKGKMIVITEGEIDTLTMAEIQNHGKWPVVSVPNGAKGAKKALAKSLDYLANFESVILMFDNDAAGAAAAKECAEMLGPQRCKIASLPLKDASEMLQAGRIEELLGSMWNARPYQPDGVLYGTDLLPLVLDPASVTDAIQYPWSKLNDMTYGMRLGEIICVTAGSGVGKSEFVRELSYHLGTRSKQKVGIINLEENTYRSAVGLLGIHSNQPLHLPQYRKAVTDEQMKQWFAETLGSGQYYFIDHFGSSNPEILLSRIRYLVSGCDCKWIILDHLSMIISGMSDGDERRIIDNLMTKIANLVEELGIGMILVSHLKRPEKGPGHENGGLTSLSQLRGSASIGQLSHIAIGIERNQQGPTPNVSTIRILKNRFSGQTGIGDYLAYQRDTGRLVETTLEFGQSDSEAPTTFSAVSPQQQTTQHKESDF